MSRSKAICLSLAAWVALAAFWLVSTHARHPTWMLAVIVTTCLMFAYATAAYLNHFLLVPRFWRTARKKRYAFFLSAAMLILTGMALAVIRYSYFHMYGPDPDPNGLYKHYGIDLFGMVVHLILAAGVVKVFGWITRLGVKKAEPDAPAGGGA